MQAMESSSTLFWLHFWVTWLVLAVANKVQIMGWHCFVLFCIAFIEFYNFWLVTSITSGWCYRHLLFTLKLTICLFWCMGTGEARPSSQTICGWFYGSCTSLMLDISQAWTSVTITAYINLLYFQFLKNSWLNQLLYDIWYLHNMHECLE
jgi:hypothetical protein